MVLSRLNSLIWLPVFILLLGCRHNNTDKTDGLAIIDISNNLGKYKAIPVSEYVTEFEYIPLETGDECLIAVKRYIIVTSTHIFIGADKCYAFGRNGRFIGSIGRIGQGPEEYTHLTGISIDTTKQSLYINSYRKLLEYSYDGKFRTSIKKPEYPEGAYIGSAFFVRDNLFMGHDPNHFGNATYSFQLFNESGQVVKSFKNHMRINFTGTMNNVLSNNAMIPFRIEECLYVKEIYNDTLYYLNEKYELVPQFVFNLGKYAISKEKKSTPIRRVATLNNLLAGVISIPYDPPRPMVGTPNQIFFSYIIHGVSTIGISLPQGRKREVLPPGARQGDHRISVGIYDIKNKKTHLLDTHPVTRMIGLINDLDGGLSFWPRYCSSDNELIDVWYAHEMKEILTDKYFATHEIKNHQAHQKLKELLKNIDEEDNPVIVIGKLKNNQNPSTISK